MMSVQVRLRALNRLGIWLVAVLVVTASFAVRTQADDSEPLVITKNTILDPSRSYSRIVIKASDITVDGQGAWLIGATEGKPNSYKGVAIESEGMNKVTLKNV